MKYEEALSLLWKKISFAFIIPSSVMWQIHAAQDVEELDKKIASTADRCLGEEKGKAWLAEQINAGNYKEHRIGNAYLENSNILDQLNNKSLSEF